MLSPGTRFGPYQVGARIGSGGMGEVYRARDTKLNRDVAIKVLLPTVANDPDRLARFSREAQTLASLNHPNIAHIHGLVDEKETRALVMELVEGPTLADRVATGAIPIDEALSIAKQIAEALEAAHEQGIIHRDLKPANLKVRPDGTVKVLDFGLAKATETAGLSSASVSMSPTLTSPAMTQAGMILGTAAYMSPEQAKGGNADKRSDVWAFGCVLYEMLSGARPFDGHDTADVLGAVLRLEPDWSRLPPETPPLIRSLVQGCLVKDRWRRVSDIAAARFALNTSASVASADAPSRSAPTTQRRVVPLAVASVLGAALAALAMWLLMRPAPRADPVLQLSVRLPENTPVGFVALSPEGRRMIISYKDRLWLRALDAPQLQPLTDTEGGRAPFWSPDGRSIGFFADGKLEIVPATGGPPQVLCDGTGPSANGTWNRDGVIVFSASRVSEPIQRVNASGGPCTPVTKPEGGSSHRTPEFLPDGAHFVYVVTGGDDAKRGLHVAALADGASRHLLPDQSSAVFSASHIGNPYGYLLFLRGSTLFAQPFDPVARELAGDVIPVATDASFSLNPPAIGASVSAGGRLAYISNPGRFARRLTWRDRSGKELSKVGGPEDHRHVSLSPDGNSAAVGRLSPSGPLGIWLYDLKRGGDTRFTSPAVPGSAPVWSPDGTWIAFAATDGLYVKEAGGGAKEERILESDNAAPSDWSADGRHLIYTETDSKGRGDIWLLVDPLSKSGERKPVRFQGTDAIETQGQLSPDAHWLAYVSNESGQRNVYVRPFPSGPGRWKISTGPTYNAEPRWRRDGKELFYLETTSSTDYRLMAASVAPAARGDFKASEPQALFDFRVIASLDTQNRFLYSPSADGQRFLVNVQADDAEPALNVISNWERAALGRP